MFLNPFPYPIDDFDLDFLLKTIIKKITSMIFIFPY